MDPAPNRGGRGGKAPGRGGRGNSDVCYRCNKPGHMARDCPQKSQNPGGKHECKSHDNPNKGQTYNGDINSYVKTNATATGTFIDTHIHWEYIFEKQRIMGPESYSQFTKKNKMPHNFAGSISIFCDPAALSSFGTWPELLLEDNIWGAFGCHPHNAKYYNESLVEKIVTCLQHPKAIAWGETGLDFKKSASPHDIQKKVFADQIQQAVKYKKPLVVHSRSAEDETLAILKENLPSDWPVHIHCFSDSPKAATDLLKNFSKLYIGVTGSLTFNSADSLRETIAAVPLDRLLLETDGPYMSPEPFGSKTVCHSAFIPLIAQKVAELKKVTLDEVYLQIRKNTTEMYGI